MPARFPAMVVWSSIRPGFAQANGFPRRREASLYQTAQKHGVKPARSTKKL